MEAQKAFMSKALEGRRAVITGGTRGIGFAVARRLLEAGAAVAVCGRSNDGVEKAVAELTSLASDPDKVAGYPADITNRDQVSKLFEFVDQRLGGVDVLVNNAGIGLFANVADITFDEWRSVLDTNLTGAFLCSHEAVGRMRKRGGGAIVNISSLAGKNAFAGGAAYNASKFGLNGFTEAMMLDLRYDNIRVSTVAPGSVATEFRSGGSADWKIQPEDVADVVFMILSMPSRTLVSSVELRPSQPRK
ncbi:MAG: SDR family oxidoreductase [Bryobacteraceae bacterium]|nr:SDR family oxidoreductase [Bryobacteraceae bacterium]